MVGDISVLSNLQSTLLYTITFHHHNKPIRQNLSNKISHFLLEFMKPKPSEFQSGECASRSVVSSSLQFHGLQPARLLCPLNSPGKNTGMGSCFLLQGFS